MLLQSGERLILCSEGVAIKKFQFTGCVTDRRLLLLDSRVTDMPVAAKEILRESILRCERDALSVQEPVLILSIRTSDEETRTMKISFAGEGTDREAEASEWVRILNEGPSRFQEELPRAMSTPPGLITSRQRAAPLFPEVERVRTVPHVLPGGPEKAASPRVSPEKRPVTLPRRVGGNIRESGDLFQFCYQCGKRIPPMANFCPYCGSRMNFANLQGEVKDPAPAAPSATRAPTSPSRSPPPEQGAVEPEGTERTRSLRRFLHRGP